MFKRQGKNGRSDGSVHQVFIRHDIC